MNIFVTGGGGFLGTALCARLRADGHSVVLPGSRQCDLRRPEDLAAFSDDRYDRIYHLAAWTQAGDFCLHHPGEQWVINQQINANVLAWWQAAQRDSKLICMGTSCSYDPELPLVEENYAVGTPIESLYTYAMTKRMLYAGLLALRRQFGMRYLHVVPSTLYGPGYHADGRQMHFIFDLIRKILRGHYYGEPVVLWGDGHQRRELVYIDDFVDTVIRLDERVENDTVNVGAPDDASIRDFARIVCEEVGYPFERIQWDTDRYVGARSKSLDVGKLHGLVPDTLSTPLRDGIARTIAWFISERDKLIPPGRERATA